MMDVEGGADSQSRITRGRLNIHFLKARLTDYFAVSHTVECHSTGETEFSQLRDPMERAQTFEHHLIEPRLERRREVAMARLDRLVRRARRAQSLHQCIRIEPADHRLARFPCGLDALAMMREVVA